MDKQAHTAHKRSRIMMCPFANTHIITLKAMYMCVRVCMHHIVAVIIVPQKSFIIAYNICNIHVHIQISVCSSKHHINAHTHTNELQWFGYYLCWSNCAGGDHELPSVGLRWHSNYIQLLTVLMHAYVCICVYICMHVCVCVFPTFQQYCYILCALLKFKYPGVGTIVVFVVVVIAATVATSVCLLSSKPVNWISV